MNKQKDAATNLHLYFLPMSSDIVKKDSANKILSVEVSNYKIIWSGYNLHFVCFVRYVIATTCYVTPTIFQNFLILPSLFFYRPYFYSTLSITLEATIVSWIVATFTRERYRISRKEYYRHTALSYTILQHVIPSIKTVQACRVLSK